MVEIIRIFLKLSKRWELDYKESWTTKKAECWRIDSFELRCWRRLLRIPWTARISNQSILKEINPEYSLEGLMLKLKLQYFGHLMRRTDSLEKTLMLGKIEGRNRRGWQRMRWLDGIYWVLVDSGSWWWIGRPGVLWFMGSQRVGHNWTELNESVVTFSKKRLYSSYFGKKRQDGERKGRGGERAVSSIKRNCS